MSLNVLAVDDSRTMRSLLDYTLSGAGFNVTLAEDGLDGLEKLNNGTPDVIITDLNMPNMDGFGFVEAVRGKEELHGLPILILTTESAQELKQKARDMGATGWIVKPFDDEKLVATVRRVAIC